MKARGIPSWVPPCLGIVIGGAIVFVVMFGMLNSERSARRDQHRSDSAQIRKNAAGLAEANRRLVQLGGPPVVIVQAPSSPQNNGNVTTTSSVPRPPTSVTQPTTTPTTKKCTVTPATVPLVGSTPGVLCSG